MLSRRSFLKFLGVAPVALAVAPAAVETVDCMVVGDSVLDIVGEDMGQRTSASELASRKLIDSYYEQLMDVFDDGWYWADGMYIRRV